MIKGSQITPIDPGSGASRNLTTLTNQPDDGSAASCNDPEGATLVTHDRVFERYGVPMIWT
jgi:hypothetical protein